MKVFLKVALVCLGPLLLSACASTQKTAYGDAPPKEANAVMDADEDYVAQIENIAKQRGTKVMWVNAPRKKVPDR